MMYAAPHTKVLNDVLGGKALAVTWCEKCMTGVVFDRRVDGRNLTFAVFGSLWRDTIVIYDLETRTQWSQWDGEAKLGSLAGHRLQAVPCVIADWRTWRAQNPQGSAALLADTRKKFDASAFSQAEDYVLIAGEGRQAKAWDLGEIRRQRVINDTWEGEPVVIVYLASSGTALMYARESKGTTLTFAMSAGQLRDVDTKTVWDPFTGCALAGPLLGGQLTPRTSRLAKRAIWKRFAPNRQRLDIDG
jgi:hypothetical protein